MFVLCHFKDNPSDRIIFFDKEERNNEILENMNLEVEKDLTFKDICENYSVFPILSLNDVILTTLNPKIKTDTRRLDEMGCLFWVILETQYNLIQEKKSKLSRSQRELIVRRYNELNNL